MHLLLRCQPPFAEKKANFGSKNGLQILFALANREKNLFPLFYFRLRKHLFIANNWETFSSEISADFVQSFHSQLLRLHLRLGKFNFFFGKWSNIFWPCFWIFADLGTLRGHFFQSCQQIRKKYHLESSLFQGSSLLISKVFNGPIW